MSVKPGWQGRYYEDFQPGDIYRCRYGRTVTEADNSLFTHLTLNTNPLHFDERYAERAKFGRILVNSTFTLALLTGMSVADVSENALANLGWDEVKLPNPVFIGDTLYCETEVVSKRDSNSHPQAGLLTVRTRGLNQDGKVVIEFLRTLLVYRQEHAPSLNLFPERT
jgi:acyl dehydratase